MHQHPLVFPQPDWGLNFEGYFLIRRECAVDASTNRPLIFDAPLKGCNKS